MCVPLCEAAVRALARELCFVVGVVRDDHTVLAGVAAFKMSRTGAALEAEFLGEIDEQFGLEGFDVAFVEAALHREKVHSVLWVLEMLHRRRESWTTPVEAGLEEPLEDAHLAIGIDSVWTNDELVAPGVDHPIRGGRDHTFGPFLYRERFLDLVEASSCPGRGAVCWIGDRPEAVGPGHERADARLRARLFGLGRHRELGVHAAPERRMLGVCTKWTVGTGAFVRHRCLFALRVTQYTTFERQ